jgi:hypothetical protein
MNENQLQDFENKIEILGYKPAQIQNKFTSRNLFEQDRMNLFIWIDDKIHFYSAMQKVFQTDCIKEAFTFLEYTILKRIYSDEIFLKRGN